MLAWKWGPALAAGCTIVMKPAEQTPLTAPAHGASWRRRPASPTASSTSSPASARPPAPPSSSITDVDKIAFTGDTTTGQIIMRKPPPTRSSASRFELGGKSPNIVFADADLDAAVEGAYFGLFFNQGQCCCAGSRLFVEDKVHDEFVEQARARRPRRRKVGDPFDPATEQGPQVSTGAVRQDHGLHRRAARRKGAKLLTGGERVGDKGYFIEPTRLRRRQGRHDDRQATRSSARS